MNPLASIEQHLVSSLLSAHGQAQYEQGDVGRQELAPYVDLIKQISASYVEHDVGTRLSSPIRSALSAKAYAFYYLPINAAKVLHLMKSLTLRPDRLSVLDIGSGPGTVGLALLTLLQNPISLTCVESSPDMSALAKKLLSTFDGPATLEHLTMHPSLEQITKEKFDLIVAANVLAEMSETVASQTIDRLLSHLTDGGILLLIEPGQRLHTQRLMKLRDYICSSHPEAAPIFPCLRSDACPMLLNSTTDWCHGEISWEQPPLLSQFDTLLGFNKHRIKFSAFAFERNGSLLEGVRVLAPPTKTSAGVESLVCGEGVYGTVRISKRNRGENSKAFEKARVFDRLIFSERCTGEAPADIEIRQATHLHQGSAEKR